MSRVLSAEMQAVADAKVVRPIYLIDMDFPSGDVRLWSGSGILNSPLGSTLITNGDFSNGLVGWATSQINNGTVTHVANAVQLYAENFSNRAGVRQAFTTVSGRKYRVGFENNARVHIVARDNVGATNIAPPLGYDAGVNYHEFTAVSVLTRIELRNQISGTATLDNVNLYELEDYVGAGDLLSISEIEESADLKANGASVTLTGLNTSLIQTARDEDYQGRKMTIAIGAMNETADVIATPAILFTGFMDVMTINDGGEYSTINLTCENKLIAFERSNRRRNTDGDQRIDYPNDQGFFFVTSIQEKDFYWGQVTPAFDSVSTGGGFGGGR